MQKNMKRLKQLTWDVINNKSQNFRTKVVKSCGYKNTREPSTGYNGAR